MTKEGQLRVYHIANGEYAHQQEVQTPEEAMKLIDKWSEEDLHNPRIEYNCFGLEEYSEKAIDGEHWTEWYNENGDDIMEVMALKEVFS